MNAPTTDSIALFTNNVGASRWRYLAHRNPLATLAAPILPVIALLFVQNPLTPALLVCFALLLIVTGAPFSRVVLGVLIATPVAIAAIAVGFAVWIDPARLAYTGGPVISIGSWTLTSGALLAGLTASLRICAMLLLGMTAGIATHGPDLVRSSVQHLHIPYRIGYTALAAYRFIPRTAYELSVIRAAQRVRGHHAGRGPFAAVGRWWATIIPLMASAIRHAERVALAMNSRAFGAHATRTERHEVPWRAGDWWYLALYLLSCAILFVVGAAGWAVGAP